MVAFPHVFPEAFFILALGIASRFVHLFSSGIRSRCEGARSLSFPAMLGLVAILAGSVFGGDWLRQRREARPFRCRLLSLPMSFSSRWTRFERIDLAFTDITGPRRPNWSACRVRDPFRLRRGPPRPGRLPSHASMFTGRWPHELGIEWLTPIKSDFPMLAEYLAARGYATAGFVSNDLYCSYDTGLSRGFTYYEDYVLEKLNPLRTSVLFEEFLRTVLLTAGRADDGSIQFRERPNAAVVQLWNPERGGVDQSRVSRVARPPTRTGPSILRVSQLPRCPHTVRAARRSQAPIRPQAPDPG